MMVTFKSDIKKRKQVFTAESFAHPAKMHLGMLLWIIGKFTKPGETILDPMFGSGSTMLAARYGRNVIGVELEQKFVDIAKGNWDKVVSLPKTKFGLGECQIIQGDARDLEGLLVDSIITSPPYASEQTDNRKTLNQTILDHKGMGQGYREGYTDDNIANLHYGSIDNIITSPPYSAQINAMHRSSYPREPSPIAEEKNLPRAYSTNPDNIGNLPHGDIDAIISSPPYENTKVPPHTPEGEALRLEIAKQRGVSPDRVSYMDYTRKQPDVILTSPPYEATFNEKQHTLSGIAKRDPAMRTEVGGYSGKVDAVISSPPYEGSLQGDVEDKISSGFNSPQAVKIIKGQARGYSKEPSNIGNLRSDTYLGAMLKVYQQCYKVLKPNGLMILVTKDFIRNQKRILLSIDTIALCEQAGFTYEDWHQRKLTQQSFWRTLYYQKHPEVEKLDTEDILVFRKLSGEGVVDAVISSPPWAQVLGRQAWTDKFREQAEKTHHRVYTEASFKDEKYGESAGQIGQLPYGTVDTVISSPPYIAQTSTSKQTEKLFKGRQLFKDGRDPQQHSKGQIGDLPYDGAKINEEWIRSRQVVR